MVAPFGSLVKARTLAPLVMFVTGVITIVEGASVKEELAAACLFGLAIPTLGTTAVAWLLVRRRWGAVLVALLYWAAAEAALASVVGLVEGKQFEELLCYAAIASAITFLLAIPAWSLGMALGARRELDAGDTLLMWSSWWFGLLNALYVVVLPGARELVLPRLVCLCCALLFMTTLTRAIRRRRWCARVARGQEAGWRMRASSLDEHERLPPLFGLGRSDFAVVERHDVGAATGAPYRGGVAAEPFALVPVA